MRILFISLALTLGILGCKNASPATDTEAPAEAKSTAAVETGESDEAAEAEVAVSEISVDDADKAIQAGALPVDANSERTRKKNGTVPDAVILTSSYKYDLAQLPEDKSKDLIFYCSNTRCTASDAAAERASANGYENVHIMREGIKGWKAAGKPTANYPRS